MFDTLRQDARYAVRGLGRSPVFSLTAILSIAIGVGGTAAIYSLANSLLLTPPPGIGNPDQVVNVGRTQDGRGFDNFAYATFADYRDRIDVHGTRGYRDGAEIGKPQGTEGASPSRPSWQLLQAFSRRVRHSAVSSSMKRIERRAHTR